jgi:hypothetical protein
MVAIETITSKQRTITDKDTGGQTIADVWNPTVANLTLMVRLPNRRQLNVCGASFQPLPT